MNMTVYRRLGVAVVSSLGLVISDLTGSDLAPQIRAAASITESSLGIRAFPATGHRGQMIGGVVRVEDRSSWEFALVVEVQDPGRQGTLSFSSAHGRFKLELVDLTNDGLEEAVLISAAAWGTGVRGDRVIVYGLGASGFTQLASEDIPLETHAGVTTWYDLAYFQDPNRACPVITLTARAKRELGGTGEEVVVPPPRQNKEIYLCQN